MAVISERIEGTTITVELKSSNLLSAVYNTATSDLYVTFKNGSIYVYNNVPWAVFTKLRMSESQGKYFNSHIGKIYPFKKVK